MLEFRDIQISDKDRITSALKRSGFIGAEYTFANNMAWKRLNNSKIAFLDDFYICGSFGENNRPCFCFPSGSDDYRKVIAELKKFSENSGYPLTLVSVTEKSLAMLGELFPDAFTYEYDRDSSDYIYRTEDLINLSGKKYHQKRNHLARFSELDYDFSLISENDFDDCITFSTVTYNNKNASDDDYSIIAEQYAINTFFSYYHELGLCGGIIRIGGKIAALTIGEPVTDSVYCVHIEKADTSYNGIYVGINNCFLKAAVKDFEFVNREEDLGIDGLRRSKLSYHPAFLLDKYKVTFK